MIPNIGMFYTESTGLLTRIVAVLLPLGCYMAAFTLKRRPGIMFWWLFLLVLIHQSLNDLLFVIGIYRIQPRCQRFKRTFTRTIYC